MSKQCAEAIGVKDSSPFHPGPYVLSTVTGPGNGSALGVVWWPLRTSDLFSKMRLAPPTSSARQVQLWKGDLSHDASVLTLLWGTLFYDSLHVLSHFHGSGNRQVRGLER